MKLNARSVLVPITCVLVSACHFGGKQGAAKAPTGQVVATVEGDEITSRELRAELDGATFPNEAIRKQAEQAALQNMINRKLLAKAAQAAEIDKSPDFALQKARAEETLLAQAMQKKIIDGMPAPTREEASSYVALHPDIYAERKIFTVDQIRMAPSGDPAQLKALEPLKTMNDVEAYLTAQKIPYQRGMTRLDAMNLDPKMTEQIVKLPPNEVFVVPGGQVVFINQIRDTSVEPVTGEPAIRHALEVLKRQRTAEALARQVADLQRKAAGKIQVSKAYMPPKPAAPAPAQPAAPAAPPAAPAAPAKAT